MKLLLVTLLLILSSQGYALQCEKLLSQSPKKIMNVERISEALMRNYGILLKTDDHSLVGAWDLEARTLYARDGHIIPQESILAHELTHLATDLKLEKNPSLSDLARSVVFKAFNTSGDLNERLPYDMIPAGYQRVFGFDEVHAVLKEIRVSEAIAKKLTAEADPQASRFLRINRPLKKQVIQFLAASRFLFRQALTYLESDRKNVSVYYEPREITVHDDRIFSAQSKFKKMKKEVVAEQDAKKRSRSSRIKFRNSI